MNSTIWLAIAAVSAVTAVILARRKNRSAVIWPVAVFVFPLALLPLFALAPLAEKGTGRLDRIFLISVASVLALLAGLAMIRYGSLDPCYMYGYEVANESAAGGVSPLPLHKWAAAYNYLMTPVECLISLLEHFLGFRFLP